MNSSILRKTFDQILRTTVVPATMLHKSVEWKNEKEWRVICNSADPEYQQAEYGYFKKAPTAVYLGRQMKQNSRKLLIDIARKKGIPVYEMLINDDSPKYLLKVKRLINKPFPLME